MVEKNSKLCVSDLKALVHSILSKTLRTSKKILELSKIIQCNDVLFYTWKILYKSLLVEKANSSIYLLNVLELLEKIAPPKTANTTVIYNTDENKDLGLKHCNKKFTFNVSILQNYMAKVWQSLINRDLSFVIHKKLLFLLIESYLSKLENAIYFTDFLMGSMNIKGIIGILALEGISKLIQKFNIEYPNIYGKLYTMFEPNIFHKKYKSRLFYLADIFLSSIYLPESIVASFVKRTARFSLICAAPDVNMILKFIGNLLIRHPGLKKMIHHTEAVEVSEDPFIETENDPTKTCASSSSLWEITLLKNHCLPSISSAANFIDFNLPSVEYDFGEFLGKNYEDIIKLECKKSKKEKPSLTFVRPQHSISELKDDKLYKLWTLTK